MYLTTLLLTSPWHAFNIWSVSREEFLEFKLRHGNCSTITIAIDSTLKCDSGFPLLAFLIGKDRTDLQHIYFPIYSSYSISLLVINLRLWLEDHKAASKSRILGDRQSRDSRMTDTYQRWNLFSRCLMTKLTLILTLNDLHDAQPDPSRPSRSLNWP